MAPIDSKIECPELNLDSYEKQMKDIIQNLYELMVQVYGYDTTNGRPSRDILAEKLEQIQLGIAILHKSSQNLSVMIPQEVIQYVDDGRNPDIYNREFVELARRNNQMLKGKQEAFAQFRDVLASQMWTAMPELRRDIKQVVEMTGGKVEDIEKRVGNGAVG